MVSTYYEFFAGGGMARAGLGREWNCLFANDIDPHKAESYCTNWGAEHFHLGDVAAIKPDQLPGWADLAWASFPCQDLSLAGNYRGLTGARSGTFWPFWRLVQNLGSQGRSPRTIVLENVFGALTSHNGKDFISIACALADEGYHFGAMIIDAQLFVPQSRPRLFLIATRESTQIPAALRNSEPSLPWHPEAVARAYARLPAHVKERWVWWSPKQPQKRILDLVDVLEDAPTGVEWHSQEETNYLLSLMNELHASKVKTALELSKAQKRLIVGGIYRRTRQGQQRAEIRFDGIAGCLRTPAGGSSRQLIAVIDSGGIRTRLLSSREAGRLMGLPDAYVLPSQYNRAYQLIGDGVAVPAVSFVVKELLSPLIDVSRAETILAAAQ